MKKLYNFGLAMAIALLVCLLPMPYGYYTLVRFVAMIFFACMAYSFYTRRDTAFAVVSGALVLLFQPFFKITLGREMWNIVDVIVAVALIVLWYKHRNK